MSAAAEVSGISLDGTDVVGRDGELTVVTALLEHVEQRGEALVLVGEPGIGKSTLLAVAADSARRRGFRVLRSSGVESESHLPFAGLHQLLRPALCGIDRLPPPQRDALRAALGIALGQSEPDPYLIGLAALGLLTDLAATQPVVVIADNAHWLDHASNEVLAFVGRRIESEPLILLAAGRDGYHTCGLMGGLPELRLEGLEEPASEALLDSRAPCIAGELRARVLGLAAGNPLALAELPTTQDERREDMQVHPDLPLTARLERAFASRAADLPDCTRSALLVAAVNDGDAVSETLEAASVMLGQDVRLENLAPAVDALLIDLDGGALRFRHSLVRSAVRQAAGIADRHRAHAALAHTLAGEPDRHVWHRAASIVGPDDEVAAGLDAAAGRAGERGAVAAAVAALQRAAQLSREEADRGNRLLSAAAMAVQLGRRELVVRLLGEAQALALEESDRTRLMWIWEVLDDYRWSGRDSIATSVGLADRTGGDHPDRALDFLLTAAMKCWRFGAGRETRDAIVARARQLSVCENDPKLLATVAFAAPVSSGAEVIERVTRSGQVPADPQGLQILGAALGGLGAFEHAAGMLRPCVEQLRAEGRVGVLARALTSHCWGEIYLGSWDAATAIAQEARRLARETSQPRYAASAQLAEGLVAGMRGAFDTAEALVSDAEEVALPTGANATLALVQIARGGAALSAGLQADAYDHLRRLFDPADIAYHPAESHWAVLDFVDAAAQSGHLDDACAKVRELEAVQTTMQSPLLGIALSCVRPLIADDLAAEPLFRAGIEADMAAWPFFRARLLLSYGAWLRRRRRVSECRGPLRAAREAFDALGATPWAQRAGQELRASGDAGRDRASYTPDRLTPQELQIARMAAAGLSNREIGTRLFLSHRTISTHLYRMFPKLGVSSRRELACALGTRDAAPGVAA